MRNLMILGDWLEVAKSIPDKSVDMIFTDLPYEETSNKLDVKIPFEFIWSEYMRIIKPKGNILLFAQGKFMIELAHSNLRMYKYDVVWNKKLVSGHLNAKIQPLRQHESLLLFNESRGVYNPQFTQGKPLHSKGTAYKDKEIVNNNYGKFSHTDDLRKGSTYKYPTTIVEFQKPHPSKAKHRTEKPVALLEWGLKTYSNPGDIILDSCAGSGPIVTACENTGRYYIVVEKDPCEFEKIKNRLLVE